MMSHEEGSQTGRKDPAAAAEGAEQGQPGQGVRRHVGVPERVGAT